MKYFLDAWRLKLMSEGKWTSAAVPAEAVRAERALKVLTVFGTRPEAIKMAPLIAELERHPGRIDNRNCLTGQHKDMVAPLIELFGIRVDYDLNLMRENQTLEHITVTVLQEVGRILREEKFDLLLVQGDTTTSMAAALAAFYAGVKIGHVEAGLRTFDKHQPLPRGEPTARSSTRWPISSSPTPSMAKQHLLNEGIADSAIEVTGNTVIDALLDVSNRPYSFDGTPLAALPFDTTQDRAGHRAPARELRRAVRDRSARAARTGAQVRRRHRAGLPGAPQPERARGGGPHPGRHAQRAC